MQGNKIFPAIVKFVSCILSKKFRSSRSLVGWSDFYFYGSTGVGEQHNKQVVEPEQEP
jgi:hypothetical protein